MPLPVIAGYLATLLGTLFVSQVVLDSPIGTAKTTAFRQAWPNELLPAQASVLLHLWDKITAEEYLNKMKSLGYSAQHAAEYATASRTYLQGREIIEYGWRTEQSDDEIVSTLVGNGYDLTSAEKLLHISYFRPGPADLVNWQAKEVFEPDAIARYGLADEFGAIDLTAFRKAGIDDQQALNYWMAHWQHPGWATVQTLLHRELLSADDVWEWFRTVEIPPYWRDKMMAASYHPLTRVDVRRMHKLEVLSDEQLLKAYKDVGYNEYNASLMVDWTKKYNMMDPDDPDRELTRAQLERGYRLGLLSQSQLNEALLAMGYDSDQQAFIAASIDEQGRTDEAQDWLSLLKAQTSSGLITVEEAKNKLASLGFSSASVEHYGELYAAYREQPYKIPSKTDVKSFVQAEMITADQGADFMRDLGYQDAVIELYLMTWSGGEEQYRKWVETMMAIWDEYEARARLPQSQAIISGVLGHGNS